MNWNLFEEDFPHLDRYHDLPFEEGTGLDRKQLFAESKRINDEMNGIPHPYVKAEIIRYALANAALRINVHDPFGVDLAGWLPDRPEPHSRLFDYISRGFWEHEARAMSEYGREISSLRDLYNKTGSAWSYPDVDHSKPNWEDILALGIPGLLARVEYWRDKKIADGVYDDEQKLFYEPVVIVLNALLDLFERWAVLADKYADGNVRMQDLRDGLRALKARAPETLYEVLLLTYVYSLVQEYICGIQTRTLGNCDLLWTPYYQRDLAAGRITRSDAVNMFRYFYLQYAYQGHPHAQPIHFAGTDRNGNSLVSDFSYVMLEAYEQLNIVSPKVQLAIAKNTPDAYIRKACSMIRDGHTSIVFCNEEVGRDALRHLTDDEEDLNNLALSGCYNFSLLENAQAESAGLSFVKAVELALNNGVDPTTGLRVGPETGMAEEITDFDSFYRIFMTQMNRMIDDAVKIIAFYDTHQQFINPSLLLSANFENCVREAKDFLAGGSKYHNSVVTVSCLASAVDSLYAVKKYVFDKKVITLAELRDALAANWNGYESLQFTIANDKEKYGNDIDAIDFIARDVMKQTAEYIMSKKTTTGHIYAADGEGITHGIWFGKRAGATPDGRMAGEQLSKNLQSVFGCDTSGVTAYIKSVTKIDATDYPNGAPIDFALHPTAVSGEDGLDVMVALVRTAFARGGSAVQGNIYDVKTLKAAQAEPEKYKGLQVRLCGWSQYFHKLTRDEQDMLIKQAEVIA